MFEALTAHWDLALFFVALSSVIIIYFTNNPLKHTRRFMWRRFVNWFPLGMTYAFLYMARYNLAVSKNALGTMMTKEDFGIIFAAGTTTYALSFFLNGPLVDKMGGKKGIVIAALGASIMNGLMGLATYLYLNDHMSMNLTLVFSLLYALNMYFQSFGAVSIIKVKAYWFHVRERGIFGAIFGTLISFGAYFAFDWGGSIANAAKLTMTEAPTAAQKFIRLIFAVDTGTSDAYWLIFLIPAVILVFWALMNMIFLKDSPDQAGFDEFDPHDASSDEPDAPALTMPQLIRKIVTNPIMLTIGLVEFCSGVLRNGIMQWYLVFAKEVPQLGAEFFKERWGILLAVSGMLGGFAAGYISDKIFHSRRGPPAAILSGVMTGLTVIMAIFLFKSPVIVGICATLMIFAVIGVHSIMSGTAAADFGGRKNTATASGLVDAAVYFGSSVQSLSIGYLTTIDWKYWPMFLVPFAILGALGAIKMWAAIPEATRRYLMRIEQVTIVTASGTKIESTRKTVSISES
ncbi:MAG: MFS transporter [Bdellovibrionales bacterium]|nr:MFS transporter [Bdellovibrionales bacterium]